MPATARRNQGKTAFVREVLQKNPHANAQFVRDEWTAAGHSDSISQTLVNKQRSEMGLAGNIKGGRPKRSDSPAAGSPATPGRSGAGSPNRPAPTDTRRWQRAVDRGTQGAARRAADATVADRGRDRSPALPGDEPGRPREHRRQPAANPPTAVSGPHRQSFLSRRDGPRAAHSRGWAAVRPD